MAALMPISSAKSVRRLYPSQLETFQQCRLRFQLKVVQRHAADEPFSPALAKGSVAHDVLEVCGKQWMDHSSMPADLRSLVVARLPLSNYPSQAVWETDVLEVVRWIKYGLSYLDPHASILGVERFLERTFHPEDGSAPVPLGAVAELILLRTDNSGNRFIEIIDYKTGKNFDESLLTPVITRFVLKPLISKELPGAGFMPTKFTQLYLAREQVRTTEMTLDRCFTDWELVTKTIAAIAVETAWEPTRSPRCEWCQFNGNGCVAELGDADGDLW